MHRVYYDKCTPELCVHIILTADKYAFASTITDVMTSMVCDLFARRMIKSNKRHRRNVAYQKNRIVYIRLRYVTRALKHNIFSRNLIICKAKRKKKELFY